MTVAEPDPRWADLGAQACRVLAPLFVAVDYVGSTALPGPAAKPVIELMARVIDLDEVNHTALETLGYRMVPADRPDRLVYRRENYDSTAYRLQVVTGEHWPAR